MLQLYIVFTSLLVSIMMALVFVPQTRLTKFHNQRRFGTIKKNGHQVARVKYLSGVAFMPIILMAIGVGILIDMRLIGGSTTEPFLQPVLKLIQLVVGMSLLFVVGLKDDLYGANTATKIFCIFIASSLFPVSGLWINNFYGLLGFYEVHHWVGMTFTIVLVMYLIATINMTDSIDGMASGQCSISLMIVLIFALITNTYIVALISAAGLGVTSTFFISRMLDKNRRPTFIGSCGSLPLGYLVCFVILYIYKNKEWHDVSDGIPLAAFCTMLMPAWDMLRVLKSRLTDGRKLTHPDRNMLNHKLTRMGISRKAIFAIVGLLNLLFVCINGLLLNHEVNITLLLIADTLIFSLAHFIANIIIARRNKKYAIKQWEKDYGKENWSEEEDTNTAPKTSGMQQRAKEILHDTESPKQRILDPTPEMDNIPFIADGMNEVERNIKRLLDFATASASLIAFSPLFLFSYLLIKFDDGGPAIFKQERIGRFGRPFYIYKFRSMRLDAEKEGPQLSHSAGNQDERLTRAGKFLRAHHLDELPQLWNVFNGDMAFIGYRPERLYFINKITEHDPRYYMLYQIRPGVTSYATLYNGYTDTMEKMLTRLELDLYYLKYRSWLFDIKILFLTFWHIIGGKKF